MSKIILILAAASFLCGCQQRKANAPLTQEPASQVEVVEDSDELAGPFIDTPDGLEYDLHFSGSAAEVLDSMLRYQSDASEGSKAALHKWQWAKEVRRMLGKSAEAGDLTYLNEVADQVDEV